MKFKKITSTLMALLMIFTVFLGPSTLSAEDAKEEGHLLSGYTTFADNQGGNNSEDNEYSLNLRLFRPDFSDFESIFATYTSYWMHDPEQKVFDQDEWALKDFLVEHELHIEGEANTVVKNMTYTAESYNWDGNISFEDIRIPYNKIEVEYYNKDDGNPVEPYLLHYDLYLKKADGKMILKIPRLAPKATYKGSIEDVKLINVKEIKISEADPERKNIYLDGVSGDDSLDGKLGRAVKSFARAKEIATNNQKIKRIIVVGTTSIAGDISLAGTNAKILRGKDFNKYLFKVEAGKNATLTDITIDGNSDENIGIENSLVSLEDKSELNIGNNAILRNNKIMAIKDTATRGGAVNASSATVNMTGGSVENNQATYGGGIYLYSSTMNFSGGTVQNNRSELVRDSSVSQYYSAGGGILAYEGSTINMSGKAAVFNNFANEIGGGISVGANQAGKTSILNMTGGKIDGNVAKSAGGGIFIQGGLHSGVQCKAYITAGEITNNKMESGGATEDAFGGGGIYVNGVANPWKWQGHEYYGANGELHLKNALISNNKSNGQGAGIASCPISKTKIYINDGVALYGNESGTIGNELFLYSNKFFGPHSGEARYKLAKRMLGGAPFNWTTHEGTPLPDDKHEGVLSVPEGKKYTLLALNAESAGNEMTKALTKVIISGNFSNTRGAGIGSNGTIEIGTDGDATNISVEKKWKEENNDIKSRPENIKVKLIAKIVDKEYIVEERVITAENGWKTTFKDLPTENNGNKIEYTIAEDEVSGYKTEITGNANDGFVITNTKEPEKIKVSVEGAKTWNDKNNQDGKRPTEITINLLKNGTKVATKKVTEKDGWKWKFENLDKYENGKLIEYTVSEEKVDGYKTEITGNANDGFVITNTKEPEKIKVSVEGAKTWNDKNNQDGKRPTEITINLLKNGTKVATKKVTEKDGWKWKFENLDKYENGELINYTIVEEKVEGYTTEVEGYNVKNSYTPGKTSVQVTKAWKDGNNQDGKRPDSVTIELLADGKETGKTLTLTKANNWTGSFTDLDEYKAGKKIEYTVKEEAVGNGYVSVVTGNAKEGFVVTNVRTPKPRIPKTGAGMNSSLYGWLVLTSGSLPLLIGYIRKKYTK
ncbi:MAG: hypothetical protein DBY43_05245 [Clostridiaceae bacterium]|nr:MAG: hypothetical protein DBY43_05245 [Clostridiaceae bacterium]